MTIQERIDALTAERGAIEEQYAAATAIVTQAITDGLVSAGNFSEVCERGELTLVADMKLLCGDVTQERLDQVKQALDDCRRLGRANLAHQIAVDVLQKRLANAS